MELVTKTPQTKFKIVSKPGTNRFMTVSHNDKLISDCFGYGYITKFSAFNGTVFFLKKKTEYVKQNNIAKNSSKSRKRSKSRRALDLRA